MLQPMAIWFRRRELAPQKKAGTAFRVFVRVRPLHPHESEQGEYVAIDDMPSALVCHDARLARSGRRLSMLHRWYSCDAVFGCNTSDAAVCSTVLVPLLERVVHGEGDATALLYGQTGAGKTHNLRAFIECVQKRIDDVGSNVEALFFEVATEGCHDLLNERAKVALRSDAEQAVHVCGARRATASSGEELAAMLAAGLALRHAVATEANPFSSRSHAILELRFSSSGRSLQLVDLAGSERNYETHHMSSRQFQRESIAINKSLMALKTCLRVAAGRAEVSAEQGCGKQGSVRVPYRDSSLTRVLRQCFEDASHQTVILAAVSPAASSVIHTLNTMDHVTLMAPHLSTRECEVNVPRVGSSGGFSYQSVPVHLWTPAQVIEWVSNTDGGRFSQVALPTGIDGKGLLGLSARRLSELIESGHEAGRADGEGWYVSAQARVGRALFNALRDAQMESPVSRV
mmetsp:Transcript_30992/g.72010  ORF Transcript_30992/g.72010 Transcript_30992/m.72010 type:complete len:459 (-) Transcript_30992:369-1745(-)